MSPLKLIRFYDQSDYALMVLFESWVQLTSLLEASASILEAEGFATASMTEAIDRGDRALVAALRRDHATERKS